MVGRTIGKYRIVEQIGRGGMGTVYKAIDETLDRQVAIKVLNGDVLEQESIERFRREAMTLAKMNHPRIGAIHELTRDGHDLLMVMEFLEGESCEKLIERSGQMAVSQAVGICAQVLDALQYAHSAGVVHRDLKPANIMISPGGDVKVMDFGIARVQGSEHLTTHGFMVGTPAYMSPEQVRGEEVDPRMDLYAIAVVFYRLLTNHLPFSGDTAIAMIHSQLTNAPTPARQYRADLPEWVVAVLTRGLSKTATDRFQSAAEFRASLENGLTGKMPAVTTLPGDEITIGPMETPPLPMAMPMPSATVSRHPEQSGIVPGVTTGAPGPSTSQYAAGPAGTATNVTLPGATGTLPGPVSPPSKPQATVTLRAPHLATAGLLIVGLVVAGAVLAVVLVRRSGNRSEPAPAPIEVVATAPAPEPVQPAPTTPEPAPAPAPAPVRPTPAPPLASTPTIPPASTTTTPSGRGSDAPSAAPSRRGGPAAPAAIPAAANAPAQDFGEIRVVMADGSKGKEVEATLTLEPGNLVTRSRDKGKDTLRTLPYRSVVAVTYVRGRRPKGQATTGAADVPENYVGGGVFGGARHWLTLQAAGEFLILRLEDKNIITAMAAIEARTGVTVKRETNNN